MVPIIIPALMKRNCNNTVEVPILFSKKNRQQVDIKLVNSWKIFFAYIVQATVTVYW